MDMQSGHTGRGGLLNSLSVQLGLLAIVVIVLLVIAWRYIW
jgi:hypothetical protein